jgi:magnesium transporter
MQTQIKKLENLMWVNIVNPEIMEVKKILNENSMNENLAEEIVEPTLRAKADTLRNAIYMTLHFPIRRDGVSEVEEVDFLIKSNLIISSQYKEIGEIKTFVENLDKVNVDRKYNNQTHGGVYFVHFLKNIYKSLEDSLNKVNEDIRLIEKNIFAGDERKSIEEISTVSKKVFDFRASLRSHKNVLSVYNDSAIKIFGIEYGIYSDMLNEAYERVQTAIESQREMLEDLKDTTNFLISNKTNQIVKVFTVVTFTFRKVW